MFYLDLFRALDEHRVRYVLVGGLAMNLHGVPRMTMDVDLVLGLDPENLRRFFDVAKKLSLKPAVPIELEQMADPDHRKRWQEEKHLVALPLRPPKASDPTIDVLLTVPMDIEAAVDNAEIRQVAGIPIRIAGIDDLIRMKQHAGRKQDHADLEHLLRIKAKEGHNGSQSE